MRRAIRFAAEYPKIKTISIMGDSIMSTFLFGTLIGAVVAICVLLVTDYIRIGDEDMPGQDYMDL